MHFKSSVLLATALTAGSAVARLHGHERRHAHPKVEAEIENIPAAPATTEAPKIEAEIEKRDGDMVYATIDGVLQSWINNWFGEVSESTSTSTSTSTFATSTVTPAAEFTAYPSNVESTVSPVPMTTSSSSSGSGSGSGSSSGGDWHNTPASGSFSRKGFGEPTDSKRTGPLDWDYQGNVGSPWGSNIIQVDEADASQYKHVVRFEGSNEEPWEVIFWNTYGPDGKMDGFWAPHKAISFSLEANEVKYVAIDDNSQGGWAAAPGKEVPTNNVGQWAATWGEFDMSNSQNDNFSGWDVSCIIPQLGGLDIQGMRICDHTGGKCSAIGKGLLGLLNAYTSADQGKPDKAVSAPAGPVRLVVNLDYSA